MSARDAVPLPLFHRVRAELISAVPTSLVSFATVGSFVQIFGRWDFLWPMTATAFIVHMWGVAVRALRPPTALAVVTPTLSVFFTVGWMRFGDSLWFGIPLSSAWSAMWSELRSAWELVGDVVTPVEFSGVFGATGLFVIAFVAAVTDSFAARYGGRVEVFVPAAATLFIVATVGTGQSRLEISTAWLMTAILATFLIRRDRMSRTEVMRRVRSAPRSASFRSFLGVVIFIASIGAIAYSVGPLLPGAGDEAWLTERARGGARELQPLVDVRRQLTEPSPGTLFRVQADAAAYWRVTSLADFDGDTWTISESQLDSAAGTLAPPVAASDRGIDAVNNFQRFTIENLSGSLVPVAATPTRLRSSTQSLFYEPESGTLLMGAVGVRSGDVYEMESTMISPRAERLEAASVVSPPGQIYLSLPKESAAISRLREIALSIAPPELSPYQRALALQDHFRTRFTYSLEVPPLDDSDATLQFLERRSGYCEHFSSTFALFARLIGLPARVAVGFTPGERSRSESGANVFTVRSTHAHAWPEVWFDDLGWILFEPTPGRGAPNSTYTNVPEEQNEEPAPTTTTPQTTTTTAPTASPTTLSPTAIDQDSGDSTASSTEDRLIWPYVSILVVAVFAVLWSFVLPAAIRNAIRSKDDPVVLRLWRRAVALYELERGPFDTSLSPNELAMQATSRLYDDDEFIFELARHTTESLYGQLALTQTEIADLEVRGDRYLAERRRRLSWPHRMRARLDPIAVWKLAGGSRLR